MRVSTSVFKTLVRPCFEYGLALGGYDLRQLKPVCAVHAKAVAAICGWNTVHVCSAFLGLVGVKQRAMELQARFWWRVQGMAPDTLAYWVLRAYRSAEQANSDTLCWALDHSALWHTVQDEGPTDDVVEQWGRMERQQWARTAVGVRFFDARRRPDIVVRSALPKQVERALVAWRVGALSSGNRVCVATGHALSRRAVAECVDASVLLRRYPLLIQPRPAGVNELVWEEASVVDRIFLATGKAKWMQEDEEVRFVHEVAMRVQQQCLGLRPWA